MNYKSLLLSEEFEPKSPSPEPYLISATPLKLADSAKDLYVWFVQLSHNQAKNINFRFNNLNLTNHVNRCLAM